jgi:hypothetical protein
MYNNKSPIARQFSILPYFWLWVLLSKQYHKSVFKILYLNTIKVKKLRKLLDVPIRLASKKYSKFVVFTTLLLFFVGYKKIGKNRNFSHFIRHHYLLAALYFGAFLATSQFLTFFFKFNLLSKFMVKLVEFLFYVWTCLCLAYSSLCGMFGRETKNFTLFRDAIRAHLPKK